MKTSELIKALEESLQQNGDMPVYITFHDYPEEVRGIHLWSQDKYDSYVPGGVIGHIFGRTKEKGLLIH